MIRQHYVQRLEEIRDDVVALGDTVEEQLKRAIDSLRSQDTVVAAWVNENDIRIDDVRRQLEEQAIEMLATQQPVFAQDLRLLAVVAAVATELERIGDYASSIARRVLANPDYFAKIEWSADMEQMVNVTREMLHTSIQAFLSQDANMAYSLAKTDHTVDALRDSLRASFISMAHRHEDYIDSAIDMLEIVHVLERTADRATNIGERVIYIVTSSMEDINP